MKKCDHFKDLILTDYIDGELHKNSAENVESHLLDCSDCRAFLKEVKNNMALPLHRAAHQPVPAELWDTIKQKIEQENQEVSPWANFVDGFKGILAFPRMVPIFGSLAVMLLAGSVTLHTIQIEKTQAMAQSKDQGEYLLALLSSTGSPTSSDNNDLGTPIEHYFL
jgi:anti-sigma factor RsiW